MVDHGSFLDKGKSAPAVTGFLPAGVLAFYAELYGLIRKSYDELKRLEIPLASAGPGELPIIKSDTFSFNGTARPMLLKSLGEVAGVIEKYNSGLSFVSMLERASKEPLYPERIAMSILSRDADALAGISEECRVTAEEIVFLAVNWLKPYFILIGEANRDKIDFNEWLHSRCPVCGYLPDMSLLRDSLEGKRFLHCALCETEWVFKRVTCASCGNEEASTLGYFTPEDAQNYRVDYCDKCRNYIKTRRLAKSADDSEYDLAVENVLTAYLDCLLIEKGYSRP